MALVTVVEDLGLSLEFPDPEEDQVFWDRGDWLKFLDLGWAKGLSYEEGSAAFGRKRSSFSRAAALERKKLSSKTRVFNLKRELILKSHATKVLRKLRSKRRASWSKLQRRAAVILTAGFLFQSEQLPDGSLPLAMLKDQLVVAKLDPLWVDVVVEHCV